MILYCIFGQSVSHVARGLPLPMQRVSWNFGYTSCDLSARLPVVRIAPPSSPPDLPSICRPTAPYSVDCPPAWGRLTQTAGSDLLVRVGDYPGRDLGVPRAPQRVSGLLKHRLKPHTLRLANSCTWPWGPGQGVKAVGGIVPSHAPIGLKLRLCLFLATPSTRK